MHSMIKVVNPYAFYEDIKKKYGKFEKALPQSKKEWEYIMKNYNTKIIEDPFDFGFKKNEKK